MCWSHLANLTSVNSLCFLYLSSGIVSKFLSGPSRPEQKIGIRVVAGLLPKATISSAVTNRTLCPMTLWHASLPLSHWSSALRGLSFKHYRNNVMEETQHCNTNQALLWLLSCLTPTKIRNWISFFWQGCSIIPRFTFLFVLRQYC